PPGSAGARGGNSALVAAGRYLRSGQPPSRGSGPVAPVALAAPSEASGGHRHSADRPRRAIGAAALRQPARQEGRFGPPGGSSHRLPAQRRTTPRAAGEAAGERPAGVGGADFGRAKGKEASLWGPLPGARVEAERIVESFRSRFAKTATR